MNQVDNPRNMKYSALKILKAKQQRTMHRLDVNMMTQKCGTQLDDVITDFRPIDVRQGECKDSSKYISDMLCEDYENVWADRSGRKQRLQKFPGMAKLSIVLKLL
eukprot:gene33036-42744_t